MTGTDDVTPPQRPMAAINLDAVQAVLAPHLALYRRRPPTYQTTMLQQLADVWDEHGRVLDIGGGTGVVGEAIQQLFGASITSVDVEDRFVRGLSTETATFDGEHLPFQDSAFDAAVLNNVLHHVPISQRQKLMRECRRVCKGPVYIKDHLAISGIDHARLAALDLMGNLPFSGMLSAHYLTATEWAELASATGYQEVARTSAPYRSGFFATVFPNRLEIMMKWLPRS